MKYKFDIFISYSSKDRSIVEHLSIILRDKGFSIWLDEWEIRVGEQIIQKISEGLESSRHLAIWLSKNSVNSTWVETEWQLKFGDEVNSDLTVVLPLLGEKCEIPPLLRWKKYANFSQSFDNGLAELLQVVELNCSAVIESCIGDLIEGTKDAPESANKLGQIAIRAKDEIAFLGLWEAAQKNQKPYSVVDHIVYYFGRVMIETDDERLKELGFDILVKSASSDSEIIIDKFAYCAGDIALESEDELLRKRLIQFIKKNCEGNAVLPKEKYSITKRRMEAISNNIFRSNV